MSAPENSVIQSTAPDDALKAQSDNIQNLTEVSKNSRTTFLAILLACAYSYLTIGTTTDASLLSNTVASPLPIIQAQVPIVWFYYFSPLILLLLFIYFHLYLQRFWRCVAALPLYHNDGRSIDDYVYPWLLSAAFLRAKIPALRASKKFRIPLESTVSIFLAWWLVPMTLVFFWARYLPAQDWQGTCVHIIIIVVAVGGGCRFYSTAKNLVHPHAFSDASRSRLNRNLIDIVTPTLVGGLLVFVSFGAIKGAPGEKCESESLSECTFRYSGERLLEWLRYSPFVDIEGRNLTEKPDNWLTLLRSENVKERLEGITGPILTKRNLRFANAKQAFLTRSDLREANMHWIRLEKAVLVGANLKEAKVHHGQLDEVQLQWADLTSAKLPYADLPQANLQHSILEHADFKKSVLFRADLQHAVGTEAIFNGADLRFSNLSGATFPNAQLRNTQLQRAILTNADFESSNFEEASLQYAVMIDATLYKASFHEADLTEAILVSADLYRAKFTNATLNSADLQSAVSNKTDFSDAHLLAANLREADLREAVFTNADLTDVDLSGADLTKAILTSAVLVRADLSGAHLYEAVLEGCDLRGAVLIGAKGLKQEQLQQACGDNTTRLDENLNLHQCRNESAPK